jgi:hypothetical protein
MRFTKRAEAGLCSPVLVITAARRSGCWYLPKRPNGNTDHLLLDGDCCERAPLPAGKQIASYVGIHS